MLSVDETVIKPTKSAWKRIFLPAEFRKENATKKIHQENQANCK